MINPEDAPRLPKLPFILGDIALLLLAWLIGDRHPSPFSPLPLLLITGCVVGGAVLLVVPFIINYGRDQDEVATGLRRELGEQFKKLMAAAEHLQHATVQLKTIEENATKNLHVAEKLPQRLQEKMAEFNQQLAETQNDEREALEQEVNTLRAAESERLVTVADKIAKSTAEWIKLEAETRKQLAAAEAVLAKAPGLIESSAAKAQASTEAALGGSVASAEQALAKAATLAAAQLDQKLSAALTEIDQRVAALTAAVTSAAVASAASPAPAVPTPPIPAEPAPEPAASSGPVDPSEAGTFPQEPAILPKAPRKPRPPRKPKPEEPAATPPAETSAPPETAPAASEPADKPTSARDLIVEPVADEAPAPESYSQVPPDESRPAATPTSDGATRLTVTSYIGIGNKLHLRGEGPGLSWDKGVPLQFLSIGRWRWETAAATGPITCKVYKNDRLEAPIGAITLTPGTELEVAATF